MAAISGCLLGVYHHFQQFFSYLLTTRLTGGEKPRQITSWPGIPPTLGRCLVTLTHEAGWAGVNPATTVLGLWFWVSDLYHSATQQSSFMQVWVTGHNFESWPPKDHPCHIYFKLPVSEEKIFTHFFPYRPMLNHVCWWRLCWLQTGSLVSEEKIFTHFSLMCPM